MGLRRLISKTKDMYSTWTLQVTVFVICVAFVHSAPFQNVTNGKTSREKGCYYLSEHYHNGERIDTYEPCLNCTCMNSVLMCYLRICPFVKPVGEECIVERDEGDCCPKIWCPEVLNENSNQKGQEPGCYLDNKYYPDGAQLPHDPRHPCEVCYCIRNSTACVVQECELKVEGCSPIYKEGQCCPGRYNCTYEEATPTPPGVTISELAEGCYLDDGTFVSDGEAVNSSNPCEHCYCMRNEVVCAIQECQAPSNNCKPVPPKPDQCCPDRYECVITADNADGSFVLPEHSEGLVLTTVFTKDSTVSHVPSYLESHSTGIKGVPKKDIDEELKPVYVASSEYSSTDQNFETTSSPVDYSSPKPVKIPGIKGATKIHSSEQTTPSKVLEVKRIVSTDSPSFDTEKSTEHQKDDKTTEEIESQPSSTSTKASYEDPSTEHTPSPKPLRVIGGVKGASKKRPTGSVTEEHDEIKAAASGEEDESFTSSPISAKIHSSDAASFSEIYESSVTQQIPKGVKGKRPPTRRPPQERPVKRPSGDSFHQGGVKQSGIKDSTKTGYHHVKGKRPTSQNRPILPVGVIPGEKRDPFQTTKQPVVVQPIPGEGICRIGDVIYRHGEEIAPISACKKNCKCVNSKIFCDEITCDTTEYPNCKIIQRPDECCPHYECGTEETSSVESVSVTEVSYEDYSFVTSEVVDGKEHTTKDTELASDADDSLGLDHTKDSSITLPTTHHDESVVYSSSTTSSDVDDSEHSTAKEESIEYSSSTTSSDVDDSEHSTTNEESIEYSSSTTSSGVDDSEHSTTKEESVEYSSSKTSSDTEHSTTKEESIDTTLSPKVSIITSSDTTLETSFEKTVSTTADVTTTKENDSEFSSIEVSSTLSSENINMQEMSSINIAGEEISVEDNEIPFEKSSTEGSISEVTDDSFEGTSRVTVYDELTASEEASHDSESITEKSTASEHLYSSTTSSSFSDEAVQSTEKPTEGETDHLSSHKPYAEVTDPIQTKVESASTKSSITSESTSYSNESAKEHTETVYEDAASSTEDNSQESIHAKQTKTTSEYPTEFTSTQEKTEDSVTKKIPETTESDSFFSKITAFFSSTVSTEDDIETSSEDSVKSTESLPLSSSFADITAGSADVSKSTDPKDIHTEEFSTEDQIPTEVSTHTYFSEDVEDTSLSSADSSEHSEEIHTYLPSSTHVPTDVPDADVTPTSDETKDEATPTVIFESSEKYTELEISTPSKEISDTYPAPDSAEIPDSEEVSSTELPVTENISGLDGKKTYESTIIEVSTEYPVKSLHTSPETVYTEEDTTNIDDLKPTTTEQKTTTSYEATSEITIKAQSESDRDEQYRRPASAITNNESTVKAHTEDGESTTHPSSHTEAESTTRVPFSVSTSAGTDKDITTSYPTEPITRDNTLTTYTEKSHSTSQGSFEPGNLILETSKPDTTGLVKKTLPTSMSVEDSTSTEKTHTTTHGVFEPQINFITTLEPDTLDLTNRTGTSSEDVEDKYTEKSSLTTQASFSPENLLTTLQADDSDSVEKTDLETGKIQESTESGIAEISSTTTKEVFTTENLLVTTIQSDTYDLEKKITHSSVSVEDLSSTAEDTTPFTSSTPKETTTRSSSTFEEPSTSSKKGSEFEVVTSTHEASPAEEVVSTEHTEIHYDTSALDSTTSEPDEVVTSTHEASPAEEVVPTEHTEIHYDTSALDSTFVPDKVVTSTHEASPAEEVLPTEHTEIHYDTSELDSTTYVPDEVVTSTHEASPAEEVVSTEHTEIHYDTSALDSNTSVPDEVVTSTHEASPAEEVVPTEHTEIHYDTSALDSTTSLPDRIHISEIEFGDSESEEDKLSVTISTTEKEEFKDPVMFTTTEHSAHLESFTDASTSEESEDLKTDIPSISDIATKKPDLNFTETPTIHDKYSTSSTGISHGIASDTHFGLNTIEGEITFDSETQNDYSSQTTSKDDLSIVESLHHTQKTDSPKEYDHSTTEAIEFSKKDPSISELEEKFTTEVPTEHITKESISKTSQETTSHYTEATYSASYEPSTAQQTEMITETQFPKEKSTTKHAEETISPSHFSTQKVTEDAETTASSVRYSSEHPTEEQADTTDSTAFFSTKQPATENEEISHSSTFFSTKESDTDHPQTADSPTYTSNQPAVKDEETTYSTKHFSTEHTTHAYSEVTVGISDTSKEQSSPETTDTSIDISRFSTKKPIDEQETVSSKQTVETTPGATYFTTKQDVQHAEATFSTEYHHSTENPTEDSTEITFSSTKQSHTKDEIATDSTEYTSTKQPAKETPITTVHYPTEQFIKEHVIISDGPYDFTTKLPVKDLGETTIYTESFSTVLHTKEQTDTMDSNVYSSTSQPTKENEETTATPSSISSKQAATTQPPSYPSTQDYTETTQPPSYQSSQAHTETTQPPSYPSSQAHTETAQPPSYPSSQAHTETTQHPSYPSSQAHAETTQPPSYPPSQAHTETTQPPSYPSSQAHAETTQPPSYQSSQAHTETTQHPSYPPSHTHTETTQPPSYPSSQAHTETTQPPSYPSSQDHAETTVTSLRFSTEKHVEEYTETTVSLTDFSTEQIIAGNAEMTDDKTKDDEEEIRTSTTFSTEHLTDVPSEITPSHTHLSTHKLSSEDSEEKTHIVDYSTEKPSEHSIKVSDDHITSDIYTSSSIDDYTQDKATTFSSFSGTFEPSTEKYHVSHETSEAFTEDEVTSHLTSIKEKVIQHIPTHSETDSSSNENTETFVTQEFLGSSDVHTDIRIITELYDNDITSTAEEGSEVTVKYISTTQPTILPDVTSEDVYSSPITSEKQSSEETELVNLEFTHKPVSKDQVYDKETTPELPSSVQTTRVPDAPITNNIFDLENEEGKHVENTEKPTEVNIITEIPHHFFEKETTTEITENVGFSTTKSVVEHEREVTASPTTDFMEKFSTENELKDHESTDNTSPSDEITSKIFHPKFSVVTFITRRGSTQTPSLDTIENKTVTDIEKTTSTPTMISEKDGDFETIPTTSKYSEVNEVETDTAIVTSEDGKISDSLETEFSSTNAPSTTEKSAPQTVENDENESESISYKPETTTPPFTDFSTFLDYDYLIEKDTHTTSTPKSSQEDNKLSTFTDSYHETENESTHSSVSEDYGGEIISTSSEVLKDSEIPYENTQASSEYDASDNEIIKRMNISLIDDSEKDLSSDSHELITEEIKATSEGIDSEHFTHPSTSYSEDDTEEQSSTKYTTDDPFSEKLDETTVKLTTEKVTHHFETESETMAEVATEMAVHHTKTEGEITAEVATEGTVHHSDTETHSTVHLSETDGEKADKESTVHHSVTEGETTANVVTEATVHHFDTEDETTTKVAKEATVHHFETETDATVHPSETDGEPTTEVATEATVHHSVSEDSESPESTTAEIHQEEESADDFENEGQVDLAQSITQIGDFGFTDTEKISGFHEKLSTNTTSKTTLKADISTTQSSTNFGEDTKHEESFPTVQTISSGSSLSETTIYAEQSEETEEPFSTHTISDKYDTSTFSHRETTDYTQFEVEKGTKIQIDSTFTTVTPHDSSLVTKKETQAVENTGESHSSTHGDSSHETQDYGFHKETYPPYIHTLSTKDDIPSDESSTSSSELDVEHSNLDERKRITTHDSYTSLTDYETTENSVLDKKLSNAGLPTILETDSEGLSPSKESSKPTTTTISIEFSPSSATIHAGEFSSTTTTESEAETQEQDLKLEAETASEFPVSSSPEALSSGQEDSIYPLVEEILISAHKPHTVNDSSSSTSDTTEAYSSETEPNTQSSHQTQTQDYGFHKETYPPYIHTLSTKDDISSDESTQSTKLSDEKSSDSFESHFSESVKPSYTFAETSETLSSEISPTPLIDVEEQENHHTGSFFTESNVETKPLLVPQNLVFSPEKPLYEDNLPLKSPDTNDLNLADIISKKPQETETVPPEHVEISTPTEAKTEIVQTYTSKPSNEMEIISTHVDENKFDQEFGLHIDTSSTPKHDEMNVVLDSTTMSIAEAETSSQNVISDATAESTIDPTNPPFSTQTPQEPFDQTINPEIMTESAIFTFPAEAVVFDSQINKDTFSILITDNPLEEIETTTKIATSLSSETDYPKSDYASVTDIPEASKDPETEDTHVNLHSTTSTDDRLEDKIEISSEIPTTSTSTTKAYQEIKETVYNTTNLEDKIKTVSEASTEFDHFAASLFETTDADKFHSVHEELEFDTTTQKYVEEKIVTNLNLLPSTKHPDSTTDSSLLTEKIEDVSKDGELFSIASSHTTDEPDSFKTSVSAEKDSSEEFNKDTSKPDYLSSESYKDKFETVEADLNEVSNLPHHDEKPTSINEDYGSSSDEVTSKDTTEPSMTQKTTNDPPITSTLKESTAISSTTTVVSKSPEYISDDNSKVPDDYLHVSTQKAESFTQDYDTTTTPTANSDESKVSEDAASHDTTVLSSIADASKLEHATSVLPIYKPTIEDIVFRPITSTEIPITTVSNASDASFFAKTTKFPQRKIPITTLPPNTQQLLADTLFPHSVHPSTLFEAFEHSTTLPPHHPHQAGEESYHEDGQHSSQEDGYCVYEGEIYHSAEQIPRKDPCEFCFCFRGDIICLQQSCPPPIRGCYATPIPGFCCPRFHCPVKEMHFNLTRTTTTTTADPRIGKILVPAAIETTGCAIEGKVYRAHQVVRPASGPCMLCRCETGGVMKCDPRDCQPQAPLLLRLNRDFFKKR